MTFLKDRHAEDLAGLRGDLRRLEDELQDLAKQRAYVEREIVDCKAEIERIAGIDAAVYNRAPTDEIQ